MEAPIIPVHHLPVRSRIPTRVEHIRPGGQVVRSGVHRHDFHELFFFAQGTGLHMIDLQQHEVVSPSVHLVAPGQVHGLDRSADMEGLVVMFAADAQLGSGRAAMSELFAHADNPATFRIDSVQLIEAQGLIRSMELELARMDGPVADVVEGYLGILLLKCAHWARSARGAANQRIDINDPVKRFSELVERDFKEHRSVAGYADQMAISPGHLNELVKKRLGRNASDVIHERVLLEAKRLLLHADLTVKEVSHALSMDDPAYFNRMFKKATGQTPLEYRSSIREKYGR
ncbi:MAG: helix-turn-helix domain-containing protein [Flavobacteriales bacterium]|nr:helix-turn-helix domain-containing protein [Flavobacteriales bacterium]